MAKKDRILRDSNALGESIESIIAQAPVTNAADVSPADKTSNNFSGITKRLPTFSLGVKLQELNEKDSEELAEEAGKVVKQTVVSLATVVSRFTFIHVLKTKTDTQILYLVFINLQSR